MSLTQPPTPSPLEVTVPLMGPWWYFLGCCLGGQIISSWSWRGVQEGLSCETMLCWVGHAGSGAGTEKLKSLLPSPQHMGPVGATSVLRSGERGLWDTEGC